MKLLDWLDDRTGVISAGRAFLGKKLPPKLPISYTLGGAALLLLAVQIATGIFLAVYYAPTPDHAWESVRFIEHSVTGGRLLRGIHHWGASFMVVIVALHFLRVFIFGSYRKPREVNWLLGIKLFLLVMAFGLTGYLLPWDQKAYWATTVTLRIARSIPLVGPFLSGVLGGGDRLGALTLTRFYAIHVLLLPLLAIGTAAAHVLLVQRHGTAGPPSWRGDLTTEGVPFHPAQSVRDAVVMAVVFAALVGLATIKGASLDLVADPTDAAYVPRPEWYFLGLFQLLKYFPGRLEVIGTVILPGLATLLLVALPFIDKGPARGYSARKVVLGTGLLGVAGVIALTVLGGLDKGGAEIPSWRQSGRTPFQAIAGPMVFDKRQCGTCHREDGFGTGPPLTGASWTHTAAWVRAHLSDPEYVAPGAREPDKAVPNSEAMILVAYLQLLKDGAVSSTASEADRQGVALIVREGCLGCHRIDGNGGRIGPNLVGVGGRRSKDWIVKYLPDPTAVNPDARMKAFPNLTEAERNAIADYLMAVR